MSVSDKRIDGEHRRLLGLMNLLHARARAGGSREELNRLLAELDEAYSAHFSHEEEHMAALGYPELESHRRFHQRMLLELRQARQELEERREACSPKLVGLLRLQMLTHIERSDLEYARYAQARAAA